MCRTSFFFKQRWPQSEFQIVFLSFCLFVVLSFCISVLLLFYILPSFCIVWVETFITKKGHLKYSNYASQLELITFEILAAERLRLMEFDNRLIIDCFANVVNILIWQFSTNDRFKSEKYESLLGKSISRNELYWALFDKYFWLIVIMWRNRLIPINCNYFCWPSDYD